MIGTLLATLPSPTRSVWHVGPVALRAYAGCIIAGIIAAIWLGERRLQARGVRAGVVMDVAVWAVPAGIIGARLYHVLTTPQRYFDTPGHLVDALKIWQGGLGVWGAIALGGVGAWIGCRRAGVRLPLFADAVAPGIVIAQGIGRWGNWFNNELHGATTNLPWGLKVYDFGDPNQGVAQRDLNGHLKVEGVFQPTFLYECVWDLGLAGVLLWADRRFRIGHGRLFAWYVVGYTLGRGWIEALRTDDANHILGLRLNLWTSALVCLGGILYLILSAKARPGREDSPYLDRVPAGDLDRGAATAGGESPLEGAVQDDEVSAEGAGTVESLDATTRSPQASSDAGTAQDADAAKAEQPGSTTRPG